MKRNASNPSLKLDSIARQNGNWLTPRDLVVALGHCTLLRNSQHDLAQYWRERFRLLSWEFGLASDWLSQKHRIPRMLESIASTAVTGGFFGQFLEYTWLPGEQAIYQRHGPVVKAAEHELSQRFIDHGEALLMAFWPELDGRRIKATTLVDLGLPKYPPDPVDFR